MTIPLRSTAVPAAHAPGPSRTPEGLLRAGRRTAYTAFAWVMVFLAWHVVWALTGLGTDRRRSHRRPVRGRWPGLRRRRARLPARVGVGGISDPALFGLFGLPRTPGPAAAE